MKTLIVTVVLLFSGVSFSNAQIFGSNDVCPGYRYSYSTTIVGAVTYQWNFPPGWYDVSGQGTGSVSVTCNENYGDIYCEGIDAGGNSITTLVLVTQFGGGAAVGWDVQPQNSTNCVGDPFTLNIVPNGSGGGSCLNGCGNGTAIPNVGFAVYDNAWPMGNFVGFANGSSLPVPVNPGTYTYYIYTIDYTNGTGTSQAIRIEGGCASATTNNIVQMTVPVASYAGYMQSPNPVCVGDTVYITAGASVVSAWSAIMGITILSTSATSIDAIVNSIPARALFAYYDANGCLLNETCYINVSSCNSILTGDSVVCNATTYNYSIAIPNAVTFDWMFPSGWYNVNGQGTSNASATCDGSNGWVSVTGHDATGNIIGWEQLFAQVGSATYCAQAPMAAFQSSDTVFCDKQSIDFTDLSTNNPTSWQWSFTGAQPDTSTVQSPQGIYYPTYGTFDVTLIACNAAGCDTLTFYNFIIEYQSPTDSIYQSNDTLYSTPAATYQWYEVDSGLMPGATNFFYVPFQNGNYYCSITDSAGCSGLSNVISLTTGIYQFADNRLRLTIVPNPNDGIFRVEFSSFTKIKNLQIQIINVLGEIVFEKNLENANGKFAQQINMSNKPKGIYYLKIIADDVLKTKPIIVR